MRAKSLLLISQLASLAITQSCFSAIPEIPENVQKELVYSCTFSDKEDISDWVMEGPGVARIDDGKLLIYPEFQSQLVNDLKRRGIREPNPEQEVYAGKLIELMTAKFPDTIQDYFINDGKDFRGGHIVYWNRFATPDNYQIEFDFEPISPYPLHMLCFGAVGINGKSIFDPSLQKRNGVAAQYMYGDINNYRISFFAADRGDANMRKAPGRNMVAQGPDLAALHPAKRHAIKLVKWHGTVQFYINNQRIFSYLDEDPFDGGHWGIRLMALARAQYDNFKVYRLEAKQD